MVHPNPNPSQSAYQQVTYSTLLYSTQIYPKLIQSNPTSKEVSAYQQVTILLYSTLLHLILAHPNPTLRNINTLCERSQHKQSYRLTVLSYPHTLPITLSVNCNSKPKHSKNRYCILTGLFTSVNHMVQSQCRSQFYSGVVLLDDITLQLYVIFVLHRTILPCRVES